MSFNVLLIDGHNAPGRLSAALLDQYQASLPDGTGITRMNVWEQNFNSDFKGDYQTLLDWEPDLLNIAQALDTCDHLVIAFPLWWGAEPARTKGLFDRLLMPGYAFKYHPKGPWWDRLLAGRSADVIVTMDTPPLLLRLFYGDPIGKRWSRQILGFSGFKPVRVYRFGPIRRAEAAKRFENWSQKIHKAAKTARDLKRGEKLRLPAAIERRKNARDAVRERG